MRQKFLQGNAAAIGQSTGSAIGICTAGFAAVAGFATWDQDHVAEFSGFLALSPEYFSVHAESTA